MRSFEEIGRTYLPDANSFTHIDVSLLNTVPVVSAVMGAAAGIGALHTNLAHWNVMVDNTQVFPGGPPVVKAALGIDITKEELGGPQIHTRVSGVVDNLAAHRGGGDRDDPPVPLVPPVERRRDGAARRDGRPGRPARGGAGDDRAARAPTGAQRQAAHRARRRRRLVLPDRPAVRPGPDHRAGADQRLPDRCDGERPDAQRRRHRRRRRAQGGAADRSCATCSTSRSSTSPTRPA